MYGRVGAESTVPRAQGKLARHGVRGPRAFGSLRAEGSRSMHRAGFLAPAISLARTLARVMAALVAAIHAAQNN